MADKKVYELRFYDFNLKGAAMFRNAVDENFMKARSEMGPVPGVWEVQLNGFAEFFHIAEYDNLEHLLRSRGIVRSDNEFTRLLTPLVDLQWTFPRNHLTVLAPGSDFCTDFMPSDSAVYELQTVPEGSEQPKLDSKATLVGRFLTVYGPSKTEYRLIRYPDAASAQADAVERARDLPSGWETRLMEPLPVSALK